MEQFINKWRFKKREKYLFILISVLKNFEKLNFKRNLIIFVKKLAPVDNLDNNFKRKKYQCYFKNYKTVIVIFKNLRRYQ